MERTDYVAKAKQLIARSAQTAALVIVPLALASSARATVTYSVLPTANFSCVAVDSEKAPDGSSSSCTSGAGVLALGAPAGGTGLEGVSFFTTGTLSIGILSGSAIVQMVTSGVLNQTLSVNVPLHYDFTLSTTGGTTISNWNLEFDLGSSGSLSTYGTFNASGSGAGAFSGSGTLNLLSNPAATTTVYVAATLEVLTTGGTGTVGISVPGGTSFDFLSSNGVVPEPATAGMLATGLGALALWFRRRRA
ncbi:MAG TPA: PEP-CTERM sorting domain-containing protein [Bryobacteraceae bacterium]